MIQLQADEGRAELAELDGIDALGKTIEDDGTSLYCGLAYAYTLQVVDADGRAVLCTLRIEFVALQTEVDVLRLCWLRSSIPVVSPRT